MKTLKYFLPALTIQFIWIITALRCFSLQSLRLGICFQERLASCPTDYEKVNDVNFHEVYFEIQGIP